MNTVESILQKVGPSRSSKIAEILQKKLKISAENARQYISRSRGNVLRFPIPLLPNRELFLYLAYQRKEETFWINFHAALRETNSIFGIAIDSLIARGGIIKVSEFAVISGAPRALVRQVSSERVANTLISAGVIGVSRFLDEECYVIIRTEIAYNDYRGYKIKLSIEDIILDGVREWCRKMGLSSYNKIVNRSDKEADRLVGAFKWDMTGPSYILPLRTEKNNLGFFVADVICKEDMNEFDIRYFIRKVQLLRSSLKNARFFPMLIANSFTGAALTSGHSEGLILTTPEILFGRTVGRGLINLLDTLRKAAAIATSNPDRILKLMDQLKDIEGSAGNLRGILFELITVYLAKVMGGSIDLGILATDPATGRTADIDVLRVASKGECIAIECKGKNPGGVVTLEEVETWEKKLPVFMAHLRNEPRFRESKISFELWTSGTFDPDAMELLKKMKAKRTKVPVSWKDGSEVFNFSRSAKEKKINEALKEHFMFHPLAK